MKRMGALLCVMSMVLCMVGCGAGSPGANTGKAKILSFTMNSADNGSFGDAAHLFADKVAEYTEGRYNVRIYPSDQIANGSSVTSFEMLQQGTCDFVFGSGLILSNFDEKLGVTSLPWLFNSHEEALDAMAGEGGQALKEAVESCGMVCLGIGDNGFRNWTSTDQFFKTPADFVGVKYRVPTVPMYINLFTSFGADPVSLNMSEVYVSLQQGAIEGQENPVELSAINNLFEVQKYLTISNYSYDPFYFCSSTKLWESLDDVDKDAIQRAVDDACAYQIEQREVLEAAYLENAVNEHGVEIYELSEAERETFKDVAAPIYEEYEAKHADLLTLFGHTA